METYSKKCWLYEFIGFAIYFASAIIGIGCVYLYKAHTNTILPAWLILFLVHPICLLFNIKVFLVGCKTGIAENNIIDIDKQLINQGIAKITKEYLISILIFHTFTAALILACSYSFKLDQNVHIFHIFVADLIMRPSNTFKSGLNYINNFNAK